MRQDTRDGLTSRWHGRCGKVAKRMDEKEKGLYEREVVQEGVVL